MKSLRNGYIYIYCSNESNINVFFDNLQVVHTRSPILEENHYYSYGLKIAAISSKAAGALQNSYLYQGDFSEYDEDAGYNEFYLRHYDAQIGRWTTTDPYEQFASPYLGMGNNPGGMVDPDGGSIINYWGLGGLNHFADAFAGALIGGIIGAIDNGWEGPKTGMAIGGGLGLGAGFVNWSSVGGALGNVSSWAGVGFQKQNSWILLRGDNIFWYKGKRIVQTFRATSGYEGPDINGKYWNLQVAKFQNVRDGGPIPEGDYFINLIPDPDRLAKADINNTGRLLRPPEGGIERIPKFVENPSNPGHGWSYQEWGDNRAHLEPINVWGAKPTERDFTSFYIHDSHKGYSHGCCEVQTELFQRLRKYRSMKNKRISVKVRYSNSEHKTNGGTKY